MKTIKLLTTSLLAVLCTGICSCDDNDEVVLEPIVGPKPEEIYSKHIDDYENMTCKKFYEYENDTIVFTGLTSKGHLMINMFQNSSKTKIFNWVNNVKTDTIYREYIGYGEYEEIRVKSIELSRDMSYIKSDKKFVTRLDFYGEESGDSYNGISMLFTKALFVDGGQSQMTGTLPPIGLLNTWIPNWYNDEYSFIHNCCYTSKGDTVYTLKNNETSYDDFNFYRYIVSKTGIYYSELQRSSAEDIIIDETYNDKEQQTRSIKWTKYNLKHDREIWQKELKLPFDYESDAKLSYFIIDKSTNRWKYKANIIYYDGRKKDYTFYLNIENGEISDNLKEEWKQKD